MTVFFASCLPIIILMCGLALDVGSLQLKQLQMQSAADAAALGAQLASARGLSTWATEGQDDAAINGFTNGVNGVTVTVTQPATYGEYSGYSGTFQATVTAPLKTLFMGTLLAGKNLTASAVAMAPSGSNCVYFMNASARPQSFTIAGTAVNSNCGAYVATGMSVASNANADGTAWSVTGTSAQSSISGGVTPAPAYSASTVADPLASIVQPTFSSCTYTNPNISNTTATAYPGTYCNSTVSNANITLSPGLYIFVGGASFSQVTITGTGVTLFFTKGGGFGYGQVKFSQASMNISAPTSTANGGIPGILIFADRAWTLTDTANGYDFTCTGGSFSGDGIWYTTTTGVSFSTCPVSATNYFAMVTDHLYNSGSSWTFRGNFSSLSTGNPMPASSGGLVE
jgi:Putative Flp pilus-assembly TadE/G-like